MQAIRNPKTLALALGAILAGGIAVPAFAQDAGTGASGKHWAVVGGYAHQEPTGDGTIAGSKAEFDGSGATTLGVSYYFNDHVAVEGWGAASKFDHRVSTADGKIGTVSSQPYALSAQYHFRDGNAAVRPFVGLGYFQNNIDDEDQDNLGPYADNHIGMTTPEGPMATVGMDLNFTPHLFGRVDARYMHGGSDIAVDGAKVGEADLNPVVIGVGVGARF